MQKRKAIMRSYALSVKRWQMNGRELASGSESAAGGSSCCYLNQGQKQKMI
jgi:hypothetical protein